MFGKSVVSGPGANALFATLAREAGAPQWNFHKYLIGRDGRVIGAFGSAVDPLDRALLRAIEGALQAAPGSSRHSGAAAKAQSILISHVLTLELTFIQAAAGKAIS